MGKVTLVLSPSILMLVTDHGGKSLIKESCLHERETKDLISNIPIISSSETLKTSDWVWLYNYRLLYNKGTQ